MSESNTFDLLIIGAGPGGYVAAIRAAQLGLKTALVEKDQNLGGTCLNVGCIPSKALLHSTEVFYNLQEHGAEHGIQAKDLSVDLSTLMKKKAGVVDQLRQGVVHLVMKQGVQVFNGHGRLAGDGKVEIASGKSSTFVIVPILISTFSKSCQEIFDIKLAHLLCLD